MVLRRTRRIACHAIGPTQEQDPDARRALRIVRQCRDAETFAPTYQLLYGSPGRSLALEIAGNVFNLLSVWFAARNSVHTWWCGIVGGDCVLYSLGRKYGLNITKLPVVTQNGSAFIARTTSGSREKSSFLSFTT